MVVPDGKATFLEFFFIWAEEQKWNVPNIHWRAVDWLAKRSDHAVLMIFRGAGKSTIIGIYNAWCYYVDPTYRILHQGDKDTTCYKTSRDVRSILRRHPLTREWGDNLRGEVAFWWVPGAKDERNPSMQVAGILSGITSSRADEIQNDDVETASNIGSAETREKLRYRLTEQTHISVPGSKTLYIGTPHTYESIYTEQIAAGAELLRIPMFELSHRIDNADKKNYQLPFAPEFVFTGIGTDSRLLQAGVDYKLHGRELKFAAPPNVMIDCYGPSAWPERFDRKELAKRRQKCRTLNEWDSQYQLHAKPISETRLDPDRLRAYDVEPTLRIANDESSMWLGQARIVSASCKWDPSSGKVKSDVSSIAVVFQDDTGQRYWHRSVALTGEVATTDPGGKTIIGGQVSQIVEVVKELHLPRITIETNGAGTFAAAYLKAALKQSKIIDCGVTEKHETGNKNIRILEAIEGPLMSRQLWAHVSVIDGPAVSQMREWNPGIKDQPDDYVDSLAGAISETPERIGRHVKNPGNAERQNWRPETSINEVTFEA